MEPPTEPGRRRRGLYWDRPPSGPRTWHEDWEEQQAWQQTTFRDETTLLPKSRDARRATPRSGVVTFIRSSPRTWLTQFVAGGVSSMLLLPVFYFANDRELPVGSDRWMVLSLASIPLLMYGANGLWWLVGPGATTFQLTRTALVVETRRRRISVDWAAIDSLTLVGRPMGWRNSYIDRDDMCRLRVWGAGRSRTLPPILLWGAQAFYEAERDLRAACREHDVGLRREDI